MPSITISATPAAPAAKAPPPRRAPWWRMLTLPYCLRRIAREQSRRLEVGTIEGTCLRPWLMPGDLVLIARELEPQSGDLVLTEMQYARRSAAMVGTATLPPITRMSVKQLHKTDHGDFLAAADGSVHADAHKVVGTVVAVVRRPSWRAWRCIRAPMRRLSFPVAPHA